jgi:hypothetical protein
MDTQLFIATTQFLLRNYRDFANRMALAKWALFFSIIQLFLLLPSPLFDNGRCNVRKLIRSGDETWTIYFGDGRCAKDLVLQQCVVIPQLVILYFRTTQFWKPQSVYITADQVDSELFRQLRVYCREPNTFQR